MKHELIETELKGPGSGVPRSPGLHLTPIIHDIAIKLGILKPRPGDKDNGPPPCLMEMGFMFEDLLAKVFSERMCYRPEEVTKDGIAASPDGIGVWDKEDTLGIKNGEVVLEEYKCTWMSSKRGVEDQWRWMTQIKGYCYMLGLRACILRVLWINGNYAPPTPQYQAFLLRFSDRELEENWTMITNHAKSQGWL